VLIVIMTSDYTSLLPTNWFRGMITWCCVLKRGAGFWNWVTRYVGVVRRRLVWHLNF